MFRYLFPAAFLGWLLYDLYYEREKQKKLADPLGLDIENGDS